MSRLYLLFGAIVLTAATAAFIGCAQQEDPAPPPSEVGEAAEQPVHQHADHDHGEHMEDHHAAQGHQSEEVQEALAKLSPEERALAEKQEICPVSGEPLGSMGKPYKVTVEGREVLLCCPGCEQAIKENPDEYLAKLPQG